MPFISKKELDKLINKAFVEGYQLGLDSGRFEATIKRYSPNEIREILGLKPIDIYDKGGRGYDIHGSGFNGLVTKIKYYPMCGRELKD